VHTRWLRRSNSRFCLRFAALLIRVNVDEESLQDKQAFDAMLCLVQVAAVGVGLAKFMFYKQDVSDAKEGLAKVKVAVRLKKDEGGEVEEGEGREREGGGETSFVSLDDDEGGTGKMEEVRGNK